MDTTNILNRVFSRNTFRQVIDIGGSDTYVTTVNRYTFDYAGKTNRELISEVYSEMKKNYRNEYFYKNTLFNKLLLGTHSINTTSALTEVPIEKSKADFVLINGRAVVYEIKTELDNFDRLETQIDDYYKAFDHVCVVTSEMGLDNLERIINRMGKPVGICVLQRNVKIKTVRIAERYTNDLDKETIFKILRKREYEKIIAECFEKLPEVSQFKYYKECKKLFMELPIDVIYEEFLKALKARPIVLKEEFVDIPYELKFLAYFMELHEAEYSKLNRFLNEEFGGV